MTSFSRAMTSFSRAMTSFSGAMTSFSGGMTSFSRAMTSFSGGMTSFSRAMTSFSRAMTSFSRAITSFSGGMTSFSRTMTSFSGGMTSSNEDQLNGCVFQARPGDPDCTPSGLIRAALSGDDMGGSVATSSFCSCIAYCRGRAGGRRGENVIFIVVFFYSWLLYFMGGEADKKKSYSVFSLYLLELVCIVIDH